MASKGSVSRGAAKKIKDKWKMKEWYNVYSPPIFERRVVAETISADPNLLLGRTVVTTLDTLPGEMKTHLKVKFRITNVSGKDAETSFIGHEMTSDYVRRMARRKKTKIDDVFWVTTKDGVNIQMTLVGVADSRLQRSQERNIRLLCRSVAKEVAGESPLEKYVLEMVSGELGKKLAQRCKVIYPLRRIEVIKSEVEYPKQAGGAEEAKEGSEHAEGTEHPQERVETPPAEEKIEEKKETPQEEKEGGTPSQ